MTALVADVGGTRIKVAAVSNGQVLAQQHMDANSHEGLAPQLPRISKALRVLCARIGATVGDCTALSMAFPALVDAGPHPRVLTAYGKYADAPQIDLVRWARDEFGLTLFLENDARMALLGEWRAGAGRESDDLVMMTLGTGLGTAAIIDGRLIRGRHGQAGVLGGHSTIRVGGNPCTCGNRGCGEAEASTSVLRRAASQHVEFSGSRLKTQRKIDYVTVFGLAREGDVCAAALRAECIDVWSAVIVNLIHAYDPERVILGGGIIAGMVDFWADLEGRVLSNAHTPWGRVALLPAQLGDAAALIGGELLVHQEMGR
jgi:glucokinase